MTTMIHDANNMVTYLQCLYFLFQLDNMVLRLRSTLLDRHNQTHSNHHHYTYNHSSMKAFCTSTPSPVWNSLLYNRRFAKLQILKTELFDTAYSEREHST